MSTNPKDLSAMLDELEALLACMSLTGAPALHLRAIDALPRLISIARVAQRVAELGHRQSCIDGLMQGASCMCGMQRLGAALAGGGDEP